MRKESTHWQFGQENSKKAVLPVQMETGSKKAVREWKPADMQEHRAGRCRGLAELFQESTGLRQNMRLYNVRALLFCSNLHVYDVS